MTSHENIFSDSVDSHKIIQNHEKIIRNLDIFSERFLPALVATERPLHGAQAEIRRETREAVIHTTQHLCHGKRPNEVQTRHKRIQKAQISTTYVTYVTYVKSHRISNLKGYAKSSVFSSHSCHFHSLHSSSFTLSHFHTPQTTWSTFIGLGRLL